MVLFIGFDIRITDLMVKVTGEWSELRNDSKHGLEWTRSMDKLGQAKITKEIEK